LSCHLASLARGFALTLLLGAVTGCAVSSFAGDSQLGPSVNASVRRDRLLSEGLLKIPGRRTRSSGWIAPNMRRRRALIYWGNYNDSSISVYLARGPNPPERRVITSGLSSPERLFVDSSNTVYATNLGNNTITAYERLATTPSLTISNGVNTPTGLTVDVAGTVYCANTGTDTITVYPKGQTTPSLSIPIAGAPEYLAVDRSENLYVSYLGGSKGTGVIEFPSGSASGHDLGLDLSGGGALVVDRSGNIIITDDYGLTIDVFPPGQTEPMKKIGDGGDMIFGLSLNKKENKVYASVDAAGAFAVQQLDYPDGTSFIAKISTNAGNWPIAVSPDAVL